MKTDATLAPVSWQRMIRAVEKVRDRMLRAVQALEAAKVPCAVKDGNAVEYRDSTPIKTIKNDEIRRPQPRIIIG